MIIKIIQWLALVMSWLERLHWKREGRNEAIEEADQERLNRIALADAARADADSINGMHNDPYNRDNR